MADDIEFWPLKVVVQKVGLSQAEVYRRMSEGRFPRNYDYRDGGTRKFWLASDVRAWQQQILDAQRNPRDPL
ncbi:putative transcriptional regulator [Sphingobium herbicidovorans NBRC 16415]|uniref:Transcriptional regulator n=1 Tax=Sphingobium herbicidovorans (strain ATCC 700291 / DSM 11019 / CCUG 56400 / KCTC 2939 / LMG 18315 / NBRC 16415 / MH) TaxID=1219045 RepID=A0A086PEQ2_SPHHM|nr:putative transcriptional regulator [Sphingobium herbicidovorans NBRC 16415]